MMHHHPKCEWIRAKRELCNCQVLSTTQPAEDPFARILQLEKDLEEWRGRHGKLITEMIVAHNTGYDTAYALARAARMEYERDEALKEVARLNADDVSDLL